MFELGQIVATPGALQKLEGNQQTPMEFLHKHSKGDWGEVDGEDAKLNNESVKDGGRIISAYRLADTSKIWIITEANRSATTILLPEEY